MSIIALSQGSPEWHEFRKTHIGSSDAPIIMGVSPYRTIEQLLQEKLTGVNTQVEHAGMRRGKELEPLVLELVNLKYSCNMQPAVIEHKEHTFLSASLDGYDPVSNLICEIKCPNAQDHKLAAMGQVPKKYFPQLQHAMLVTGLSEIIYASYSQSELITLHVAKDEKYSETLLDTEMKFYQSMQDGKLVHELNVIEDRPDIDSVYMQFLSYKEKADYFLELAEESKKELLALCEHRALQTKFVKIKEVKRSSYDYSRMCEDYKIDKENYKKVTNYWDIRKNES